MVGGAMLAESPRAGRILSTGRGSFSNQTIAAAAMGRPALLAAAGATMMRVAPLHCRATWGFGVIAMDQRASAIAILKRARQTLIERLTERVLDAQGEILDDAAGETFHSELETLYDQLGGRLSNVNALLAGLQSGEEHAQAPDGDADLLTLADFTSESEEILSEACEAPSVYVVSQPLEPLPLAGPASLDRFLAEIEANQLPQAAETLGELFGIGAARAEHCAAAFQQRQLESSEVLDKVARLRDELQAELSPAALGLLCECFGLHEAESAGVAKCLQARL